MAELSEEEVRDRRAMEEVLGYSLDDEPWPPDAWPMGIRVLVLKDPEWDGPWAKEFEGTISGAMPPKAITHELAQPGEYEYFVKFDEPQLDGDKEGPYGKAAIWGRYLKRLD